MMLHEEEHGVHFDMILTHDAEDLIDPDALTWMNYYAQWYDMIQIPVLAAGDWPLREVTHGVYCDEFCEYQQKDMMARSRMGGFISFKRSRDRGIPRAAPWRHFASTHSNRIFEPGCLTEDYENGFRIANMGLRQKFHSDSDTAWPAPIATREYFPRHFSSAVRQLEPLDYGDWAAITGNFIRLGRPCAISIGFGGTEKEYCGQYCGATYKCAVRLRSERHWHGRSQHITYGDSHRRHGGWHPRRWRGLVFRYCILRSGSSVVPGYMDGGSLPVCHCAW